MGRSRDPTVFTVVPEDSAALAGIVQAAAGVFFSRQFDMPRLDGVASILIGLVLAGVASFPGWQCRRLLVGRSRGSKDGRRIDRRCRGGIQSTRTAWPMTMHFGPDEVLLALDAQFHPGTLLQEIQVAINRIERRIVGPLSGGQPDPSKPVKSARKRRWHLVRAAGDRRRHRAVGLAKAARAPTGTAIADLFGRVWRRLLVQTSGGR
jgi:hypothetical protein